MTDYDNRKENQAFEHVELLQRQRESAKRAESEHCCAEADKNYEAQAHIIDAQDEHHHDEADAHVFMLNGLLVAKDVPMPKAGV